MEQLQQLLSAPPAEREAYFNRQYFCLLLRMAEECDKSLCHLCVCVCVSWGWDAGPSWSFASL